MHPPIRIRELSDGKTIAIRRNNKPTLVMLDIRPSEASSSRMKASFTMWHPDGNIPTPVSVGRVGGVGVSVDWRLELN